MSDSYTGTPGYGPYGRQGFLVRVIYLGLAWLTWFASGCRTPRGWIVLCYHAVQDHQAARFEQQMQWLAGRAVSVDRIGSDSPGVCVTFDDAFACLLQNVIPVSARLNIPITIFPVTENCDAAPRWQMPANHPERNLPTMSWQDLRILRENPRVTLGSHTATHVKLGEAPAEIVDQELISSRTSLSQILHAPPLDLALPHGSFNPAVLQAAQQAGYRRIHTLEPNVNRALSVDGRVGRFSVDPDMWLLEFRLTVAGAYRYLFRLRRGINLLRGWLRPRSKR